MPVISLEVAIEYLRAEDDDRDSIQGLLEAAEGVARRFMGRTIYSTQEALNSARVLVPGLRAQAHAAHATAVGSTPLINDFEGRDLVLSDAQYVLREAMALADAMVRGVVLDKTIEAACLLILGHLYTNREDVVAGSGTVSAMELPMGSKYLLAPYRVQMGV
ncbi:head-tail connector protein [Pseudomonas sp. LP_7_YM]|uniref:head-tail connector protein n=1 Tax=Pseudomonas sp. LP_7_YM TaxID=2485137 RepID=UPI001062372B|nr:head-tail connector protein [Pseudomonas sp. LP_7_YM]TDV60130.1 hypothetical protein EC915_11395 [Pseudomonas sp. LP_7_YM]